MTPEDKAKELIGKMEGGCCRCPNDAKEAALTCCDEIIGAIYPFIHEESSAPYFEQLEYWQQVKQHIQSL
jgi:hypothetical protein